MALGYSLQDVVPWSLIYGAQNERHQQEIQQLQKEIQKQEERFTALASFIAQDLIMCSTADFINRQSLRWKRWEYVKGMHTRDTILKAKEEIYKAHANDSWFEHAHPELEWRTQFLISMLPPPTQPS